jgi:transcriptional regulator
MHGYGIGTRLEQISKGVLRVNGGSLFPAIGRLERDGLVAGEWQVTENNRRAKYYALTKRGRATLKAQTAEWESRAQAISRVLRASPEEA